MKLVVFAKMLEFCNNQNVQGKGKEISLNAQETAKKEPESIRKVFRTQIKVWTFGQSHLLRST